MFGTQFHNHDVHPESGTSQPNPAQQRPIASWAGVATLVLLIGFSVYLAVWVFPVHTAWLPAQRIESWLSKEWSEQLNRKLTYAVAILCLLVAEKAIPVVRAQSPLSNGFFVDLGYAVLAAAFVGMFLPVYEKYLTFLYDNSFRHLELFPGVELPRLVALGIAFLVADFMAWFGHLARHKVPFFWEFHAVHHSQEDMNALTDYRVHPIGLIVVAQIRIVPIILLANSLHLVFTYLFFSWLFPKIYHANLRTNLGPLRYILVTPQSHRVHHSRHREHVDTNFGVIFSFWDRMFGTQFLDYDVYPETGISEAGYPSESGRRTAALPWLFLCQLFHPILRVVRRPSLSPEGWSAGGRAARP